MKKRGGKIRLENKEPDDKLEGKIDPLGQKREARLERPGRWLDPFTHERIARMGYPSKEYAVYDLLLKSAFVMTYILLIKSFWPS